MIFANLSSSEVKVATVRIALAEDFGAKQRFVAYNMKADRPVYEWDVDWQAYGSLDAPEILPAGSCLAGMQRPAVR